MKHVTLTDFLTDEQIEQARKIGPNARKIADEVITPNLAEINRKLGQENDALYLAYAVVYVFNSAKVWL